MKTISAAIAFVSLAFASGALAQTPAAPAASAPTPQDPAKVAAATLPNAFSGRPGAAAVAPAAVAPAASAPVAADPRTEPALRSIIAAVQATGPLDRSLFSANAASQMAEQEAPLRALLAGKGELVTILHRGQQNGADIFQAVFENGDTQWLVGVDEAGKVAVFLFRETPPTAATGG